MKTKKSIFIQALFFALVSASCTDESGAVNAVESIGFRDVQVTGYEVFGCGEGDTFSTGFVATNAQGRRVSGVVCSGFLKGSTVRFE